MTETTYKAAARFPDGQMLVSTEAKAQAGNFAMNRAYELAYKQLDKSGMAKTCVAGIYEQYGEDGEGQFLWSDDEHFHEHLSQEHEVWAEREQERRIEDAGWMDAFEEEDRRFHMGLI
jgi:hypothetical protein